MIPVLLILGVVLYEALKRPGISSQSAARRGTSPVRTPAAQNTGAVSTVDKLLQSLLRPSAQQPARTGGSGGFPSGSGGNNARASQTGFNQPSNQTIIPPGLEPFGTDSTGQPTFIDPRTGNVFDANGNLYLDNINGSIIGQSAPGDGGVVTGNLDTTGLPDLTVTGSSNSLPADLIPSDPSIPVLDTSLTGQEAALAIDATTVPIDSSLAGIDGGEATGF